MNCPDCGKELEHDQDCPRKQAEKDSDKSDQQTNKTQQESITWYGWLTRLCIK